MLNKWKDNFRQTLVKKNEREAASGSSTLPSSKEQNKRVENEELVEATALPGSR